jgi:hypothetical protein
VSDDLTCAERRELFLTRGQAKKVAGGERQQAILRQQIAEANYERAAEEFGEAEDQEASTRDAFEEADRRLRPLQAEREGLMGAIGEEAGRHETLQAAHERLSGFLALDRQDRQELDELQDRAYEYERRQPGFDPADPDYPAFEGEYVRRSSTQ